MDKRVMTKLNGGRVVEGTLRGFDPFMNLVVDDGVEVRRSGDRVRVGFVVSTYRFFMNIYVYVCVCVFEVVRVTRPSKYCISAVAFHMIMNNKFIIFLLGLQWDSKYFLYCAYMIMKSWYHSHLSRLISGIVFIWNWKLSKCNFFLKILEVLFYTLLIKN